MRLKKLQVKNYRGLNGEDNVIEFDGVDIIFLIGQNNNGKSTFLQAYNMFTQSKAIATVEDFFNKNSSNPIEIFAEFIVEDSDKGDSILEKGDPNWIDKWVNDNKCVKIMKKWTSPGKAAEKMTFDPKEKQEYIPGGFGGFDTILQKYAPTPIIISAISSPEDLEAQINKIITDNHIKKLEKEHKDKYDKVIKDLIDLKDEITNSDDINNINEKMNYMFEKIFPKLKVEVYTVPDSGIDITKTLKSTHGFKVNDNKLGLEYCDLKRNGNGVIRQALFSFLATINTGNNSNKKDYLILFEEPELYLHPEATFALREQLYSLVKDSPYQILCATHSPLMIDTSKQHASLVRLVKNDEAITRTYQVNFDLFEGEEKDYLQMINRFNPHICEAFYADEVVLVEGDTEAIIYRELISRYYSDERNIFILNTGSKANIVFYQKILTHFGIKHVIVHDVDSETYIDKKGRVKTNSMWPVNNAIWEQIEKSNEQCQNIARRYVHFRNFEDAHNYNYNKKLGKPLSAFNFAKSITLESDEKCIEFLKDLFGEQKINHTPEYIEKFIQIEQVCIKEVVVELEATIK
ncbi:hypothetical protein FC764_08230 [Clostridium botulinum]|uniref:ATP-dependent nuclease n=1 Tax=Clostridium botulinum TaxID=1491 RepID=UPI0013FB2879|nr:AAA family ATPase [Clostridium botulinum]MBN1057863.1 hypothetical protein [Clostridium botulinum]MBN1061108.1 hypothetical protein [Clostridium botulinum]NFF81221.1 hypothetical protein [Clostridium botulinum]